MLINMGTMAKEDLELKSWFPLMGTYPLKNEVGMVMVCLTLMLSPRKGRYVGHIKWYIMRKTPTAWNNLYGAGVLVVGGTIFARNGKTLMKTACLIKVPWFGNWMRVSKPLMQVIKKQYF